MVRSLGIMQGRLLPKYKGRYQAHPVGYWNQEFALAKELGFSCIEFIIDHDGWEQNPLLQDNTISEILELRKNTGVAVHSICADCFMEQKFHSGSKDEVDVAHKIMEALLASSNQLGIKDIVIPCVDHSALNSLDDKKRFVDNLGRHIPAAESHKINLCLETDLDPDNFRELLESFSSSAITVNYDIGNSVYKGYHFKDELAAYGNYISDIHIKDRLFEGGSVVLGEGDANIPGFFEELKRYDFEGIFIMQAFRDDEGLSITKHQKEWLEKWF